MTTPDKIRGWNKPEMAGGTMELELEKEDVEQLYTEGELMVVGKNNRLVKITIPAPCQLCGGCGAIVSYNSETNRQEIQKCDRCNKWSNDHQAWLAVQPAPYVENIPEDLDEFMEDLDTHLKEDDEKDRDWI